MYKISPLLIVLCLVITLHTKAQDIHYSQFYADPLRLNPANTGNFNGSYRVGLNARNQWQSITTPYQTFSGYLDVQLLNNNPVASFGTGLYLLHDKAGSGILATTEVTLATAAHLAFSSNFILSIGGAAAYIQKNINTNALTFNNQWNDSGFDYTQNNNENFTNNRQNYFDANAGLQFLAINNNLNFNIYGGVSALHLNKPQFSFYNTNNQIGTRIISNIGTRIQFQKFNLDAATYFTTQKKASEWVTGANIAYKLSNYNAQKQNNNTLLYIGLWYRNKDAIIPLIGFEYHNYRILGTYDVNLSSLKTASKGRGGFEISMVKIGTFKPKKTEHKTIFCPRF